MLADGDWVVEQGPGGTRQDAGRWGSGLGIGLLALALIAGWYLPHASPPAAPVPSPQVATAAPTSAPTSAPSETVTPVPNTPTATATPTASPTATPSATSTPTATPSVRPAVETVVYTVQEGDTLGDIAAKFGVPVEAIIDANGMADPDSLENGQRLLIPQRTDGR